MAESILSIIVVVLLIAIILGIITSCVKIVPQAKSYVGQ